MLVKINSITSAIDRNYSATFHPESMVHCAALMSSKLTLNTYDARLSAGLVSKEDPRAERDTILDLYKHHLKLVLEANIFIYAVTGALLDPT
jgi:hypothetical protein